MKIAAMRKKNVLTHEFVEFIPDELQEGTLYVSIRFATVVHRCCCACGTEVVTPLSPSDWKLIFDGENISLDPSIGNWSFDCQSHYWIEDNIVRWAPRWSREQIENGRARDRMAKKHYFDSKQEVHNTETDSPASNSIADVSEKGSFWSGV